MTAATAANTQPVRHIPTPIATEPAAGAPSAISPIALIPPISTFAMTATSSAAVGAAYLPTTVESISSSRPVSSSARVCRMTNSRLSTPVNPPTQLPNFQAVAAGTVYSPKEGPVIARMLALSLMALVKVASSCGVE